MPKRKTSKKRRRRSSGLAKGRSILSRATSAATSATRSMRSRFTRKKAPKETLWPLINKTQFPVPRKRMGKNKHDLIAEHSQCKKELEELCSSGTTKEKYDCLHNNIDNVSPECAALLIKAISPDDIYDENAEDFDLTKSALSLNRRETREFKRRNRAAIQEHIDNEFNNFHSTPPAPATSASRARRPPPRSTPRNHRSSTPRNHHPSTNHSPRLARHRSDEAARIAKETSGHYHTPRHHSRRRPHRRRSDEAVRIAKETATHT